MEAIPSSETPLHNGYKAVYTRRWQHSDNRLFWRVRTRGPVRSQCFRRWFAHASVMRCDVTRFIAVVQSFSHTEHVQKKSSWSNSFRLFRVPTAACSICFLVIWLTKSARKNYTLQCGQLWNRRMASSAMLRRVALVRTNVSEKLSASIIRVTRIDEIRTTLAV
jgi:hypothetical protein